MLISCFSLLKFTSITVDMHYPQIYCGNLSNLVLCLAHVHRNNHTMFVCLRVRMLQSVGPLRKVIYSTLFIKQKVTIKCKHVKQNYNRENAYSPY